MKHGSLATGVIIGLTVALSVPAIAADHVKQSTASDRVIIVDAPDLRKTSEQTIGPRFSSLLGQPVYSNSGKIIGEVEDFVMARGGEMYAVIDTRDGPLTELVELIDDDIVIVSLRELRRGPSFALSRDGRSLAQFIDWQLETRA